MGDKSNKYKNYRYERIYLLNDMIKDFKNSDFLKYNENILSLQPNSEGRFPGAFVEVTVKNPYYLPKVYLKTKILEKSFSIDKDGNHVDEKKYIAYFPAEKNSGITLNSEVYQNYSGQHVYYMNANSDNTIPLLERDLYSIDDERFYVINLSKESALQGTFTSTVYPYTEELSPGSIIKTENHKVKSGEFAGITFKDFDSIKLADAENATQVQFYAFIPKKEISYEAVGSIWPTVTNLNKSVAYIVGIVPNHLKEQFKHLTNPPKFHHMSGHSF